MYFFSLSFVIRLLGGFPTALWALFATTGMVWKKLLQR